MAAFLLARSLTSFSQMMDICITFDLKFRDLIGIEKDYHEDYKR
jgi:hypothetical protein